MKEVNQSQLCEAIRKETAQYLAHEHTASDAVRYADEIAAIVQNNLAYRKVIEDEQMQQQHTHVNVNPHEPLPVIGYAIVRYRVVCWEGEEAVSCYDDEEVVRVPAGRSPASMVGLSTVCGDKVLSAVLIPFAEFKELTKPVEPGISTSFNGMNSDTLRQLAAQYIQQVRAANSQGEIDAAAGAIAPYIETPEQDAWYWRHYDQAAARVQSSLTDRDRLLRDVANFNTDLNAYCGMGDLSEPF